MSQIRPVYAGLMALLSGAVMIFAGLATTLIFTRVLSQENFGFWNLIIGITTYAIVIEPIISFWVTREIPRGINSGRTSIIGASIISLGGILIYFLATILVSQEDYVDLNILFFGMFLVPLMYIRRNLAAINVGWKPEIVSYSLILSEIVKIPLSLFLVYYLNFNLNGVIWTFLTSHIIAIIVLAILGRSKLKGKFEINFMKKWFKLSWISLSVPFVEIVQRFDILIYTLTIGSVHGLTFWGIAYTFGIVVFSAAFSSQAAYTKVLQIKDRQFMQENLTRLLYFLIPFLALSLTFAKPGTFILNPLYKDGTLIIILYSLQMFFYTLNVTFNQYLMGGEIIDEKSNTHAKEYFRSKLFTLPIIRIIQYTFYLVTLFVTLHTLKDVFDEIILVTLWMCLGLIMEIPIFVYLFSSSRKKFNIKFEFRIISKYLTSAVLFFGITFVIIDKLLIFDSNVFIMLPNIILLAILSLGGYLFLTYVLDKQTRILMKGVVDEFRYNIRRYRE